MDINSIEIKKYVNKSYLKKKNVVRVCVLLIYLTLKFVDLF